MICTRHLKFTVEPLYDGETQGWRSAAAMARRDGGAIGVKWRNELSVREPYTKD